MLAFIKLITAFLLGTEVGSSCLVYSCVCWYPTSSFWQGFQKRFAALKLVLLKSFVGVSMVAPKSNIPNTEGGVGFFGVTPHVVVGGIFF